MSTYYGDDGDMGDRMEADQLMAALEERARQEATLARRRTHYGLAASAAKAEGHAVTIWKKGAQRPKDAPPWTITQPEDAAHPWVFAIVSPDGAWSGPCASTVLERMALS